MTSSKPKRIAVLSDIHGNLPALEAVVNDMKPKNIDLVINLGDHISGPLWPKETIEFLMQQNWINILGNHDRYLFEENPEKLGPSDKYAFSCLNNDEITWLRSLPSILVIDSLNLFHGTPSNDNMYLLETVENGRTRLATHQEIMQRLRQPNYEIILCGHSHIQRVVNLSDSSIIINPGSVGLQAYDDVLPEYHIIETGSPHARYAIINYQGKIESVEMISISYDKKLAVKQAYKNKRPDWVEALGSGYFKTKLKR